MTTSFSTNRGKVDYERYLPLEYHAIKIQSDLESTELMADEDIPSICHTPESVADLELTPVFYDKCAQESKWQFSGFIGA